MLAVVLNAACIDIVALFMPVYHGDPLIITLIGGVCEGVGLSLVFMRGATTGGTDMIARLLNHRLRHLSMGKLMLAVDGCVVLFSAIVYKSIESAVYACIVIFVSTKSSIQFCTAQMRATAKCSSLCPIKTMSLPTASSRRWTAA